VSYLLIERAYPDDIKTSDKISKNRLWLLIEIGFVDG
jgi:hypothetical protein